MARRLSPRQWESGAERSNLGLGSKIYINISISNYNHINVFICFKERVNKFTPVCFRSKSSLSLDEDDDHHHEYFLFIFLRLNKESRGIYKVNLLIYNTLTHACINKLITHIRLWQINWPKYVSYILIIIAIKREKKYQSQVWKSDR